MGNGIILLIIVGLLVAAYIYVPSFQNEINPYLHKSEQIASEINSSTSLSDLYNNLINNTPTNNSVINDTVDPNVYSVLGYPSKDTTYDCEYDRDCELFYSELCQSKTCVCLSNGKCAIRVITNATQ